MAETKVRRGLPSWFLIFYFLVLAGVFWFFMLNPSYAWLEGWNYRREITVTEQSGSTLTNYPVLVPLNSSNFDFSKANSDGSDIRFTDTSDNLLDYWIEEWDSTGETAKIWVKVPSIPASGTVTIYMYYGNSGATSESNFSTAFSNNLIPNGHFESDTVGGNPSNWEKLTEGGGDGVIEVVSSTSYEGSKSVYMNDTGTNSGDYPVMATSFEDKYYVKEIFWVKVLDNDFHMSLGGLPYYSTGICGKEAAKLVFGSSGKISIYDPSGEVVTNATWTAGEWTKVKIICDSRSDYDKCKFWINDQYIGEYTYREWGGEVDELNCTAFNGASATDGEWYVDAIIVQDIADPEPSVSVGAEEIASEITVQILYPESTTYYVENITANISLYWYNLDGNSTNYSLIIKLDGSEITNFTGIIASDETKYFSVPLDLYEKDNFNLTVYANATDFNKTDTDTVTFNVVLYDLEILSPSSGWYYKTINITYNATCYRSSGNITLQFKENGNAYSNITKSCPFSEVLSHLHQSSYEGNRTITIAILPLDSRENEHNDSIWYYSDLYAPNVSFWHTYIESFRTNITETYYFIVNDSVSPNMTCTININSDSYNDTPTNATTFSHDFQLEDGYNTLTISCEDLAGNTYSTTDSFYSYTKYLWFVDETTGENFTLSDANITIIAIDRGESLDMNDAGRIWTYYVSDSSELLRIEQTYEGYSDVVVRNFDLTYMPTSTPVCADALTSFYEQILYSSSNTPVYVINQFAGCYIIADKTRYAYEGALMTFAHTRSANYYLYILDSEGNKIFLASIDGSTASSIDLDMLRYTAPATEISVGADIIAISKTGNETIYFHYENTKNDNSEVTVSIYDGDNVVFSHTEVDTPNNFSLYFCYSTITLENDILKFVITKETTDGSTYTISRYFNLEGKTGSLEYHFAIFAAIGILLFSITIIAKNAALGWFGVLASVVSLALLSYAVATWEVLLFQAIVAIILMFLSVMTLTYSKTKLT